MKIIVCGKGGSGKSTLAALVAKSLKNKGFDVLVVDADESNSGLHRLLGVSYPVPILESLGGKKGFREKMAPAFPQGSGDGLFKDPMEIDDFAEQCVARADGIRLIVIGKIHEFGEGCACPMGALSRLILPKLHIKENEVVVIDTAAGVEHFGRGVDAAADIILGVVDPTYESLMLSKNMQSMAAKAGIEMLFIINKADDHTKLHMIQNVGSENVVAVIPQNQTLVVDNLAGKEIQATLKEIDPICRLIEEFKNIRKELNP